MAWFVDDIPGGNSTVGTIDSRGLYTTPAVLPNPKSVKVTATLADSGYYATAQVALYQLGTGQLAVTPEDMNFGNVLVGSSQSQTGTLNAGTSSVTVSTANWNGTGFSLCGISFPITIPAGQKVPFTVTFAPQIAGTVPGTISFISNATNSPTNAQLAGSGVPRAQQIAKVDWLPDNSAVKGYYVYRGEQTGGPYARISSLQPGPPYSDSTVIPGQTYYYVVTAVGTNSLESTHSNEVEAVIPSP